MIVPVILLSLATGTWSGHNAGFPGPESRADYDMDVVLVPDSFLIRGSSSITFTNGASFPVDTLWLHLYPNAYRDHETPFGRDLDAVGRYGFRASGEDHRGWVDLSGWAMNGSPVEVHVDDCLGYVSMEEPLRPGETVSLEGGFTVHVPSFWSRMGHAGDTYQITQWYPKMCVLDESGWHLGRYHWAGEFYSDFGDYSVRVTVPSRFVTAATGSVQETVFSGDSTLRTDRWAAENVHDFVWSSSPDYTLREHTFTYPEQLGASSVSVHLVLLDDDPEHWDDVPAVIDSTLLYYGEWYVPYPYADLWVVEPVVLMAGGMEYPQFVFSGAEIPMTRALEMVTAHEIGHQWFYGMLGNDEVDEAWLDEGMNTFSELRYMERRHGFQGNMTTTPDWFLEVSDQEMTLLTYATGASGCEREPVLSDATSAGDGSHSTGFTYYSKPALFLRMLRRQTGEDDFDIIMSTYFRRFMYHHPHTDDFQAIVEEVTGRSWDEEFDFWLRGTRSADVRVESVTRSDDSTTVRLSGDIPHDLVFDLLLVREKDSLLTEVAMSPEEESSVTVAGVWDMAVADPFLDIPDRAPWNNSLPPMAEVRLLLIPFPRPELYSLWILPFPSYAAGSWRVELLCMSSPVTSYMGGPYTWTGWASVPFEKGGFSAWGTFLHAPVLRACNRGLYGSVGLSRGYGTGSVSAGLYYHMTGRVPADPVTSLSLHAELFSVEDTTVYGGDNVETGHGFELSGGVSASDLSYRFCWDAEASGLASPGWEGGAYARADIAVDLETRITGGFVTRTRLYAGRVAGDAPLHALLRPGGGLFAGGIIGAFLPPDGSLSPGEHYYVRSGPALPGYWNSPLRARAALTAEQRIPIPIPLLPVEVYLAGGWLADGFGEFTRDDFLADAGLSLRVAMLEVLFPLWVSDPVDGEDRWEFRWRIGLSPAGFPDLY
ncbi:MAG: M1 family metallopeptidase [Candidatus Fermentibacteraceae bacterium]|nr:M1 family metallopeptidase [Candidatus Fermentibacteraceae bacterium]MBN2608444.1 M1 family metallopeptidase [Candidatus Fermentibacteraceae bacterium]